LNIVDELRELAIDLKEAHLTPVECRAGCKARHALSLLGFEPDDYHQLIKTLKQANAEGWLKAALRLAELEFGTKKGYETMIAEYEEAAKSISTKTGQVASLEAKIEAGEKKLKAMENQEQEAAVKVAYRMSSLALTEARLEKIETLRAALKVAGVSDADIPAYIERQEVLYQAGFTLETMAAIVKAAGALGDHDHGKSLLARLQKLGGLDQAIGLGEKNLTSLQSQVQGLEKAAKVKAQLESEVGNLTAKLLQLKIDVAPLETAKTELVEIQAKLAAASGKTAELEAHIAKLEGLKTQLAAEIPVKEATVADLAKVEARRDEALAALEQAVAETNLRRIDLAHLAAFEALIARGSWDEIERFAELLPNLIARARARNESSELQVWQTLTSLTGGALRILRCPSCEVVFSIARKPRRVPDNDVCPYCGEVFIKEMMDEVAVLRQAMGKAPSVPPATPPTTSTDKKPASFTAIPIGPEEKDAG